MSKHSVADTPVSRRALRQADRRTARRKNVKSVTLGVAASAVAVTGAFHFGIQARGEQPEQLDASRDHAVIPANLPAESVAMVEKIGQNMAAARVGLPTDPESGSTVEVAALAEAEAPQRDVQRRLPGNVEVNYPVDTVRVTSQYGYRNNPTAPGTMFHVAVDFAVPTGTSVKASASGTVVFAGWHSTGGNRVEIDHGNGVVTAYSHNSALNVQVGQQVEAGQEIAKAGSTGNSTGPHVHFEIMINEKWVDPTVYLPRKDGVTKESDNQTDGSSLSVAGSN